MRAASASRPTAASRPGLSLVLQEVRRGLVGERVGHGVRRYRAGVAAKLRDSRRTPDRVPAPRARHRDRRPRRHRPLQPRRPRGRPAVLLGPDPARPRVRTSSSATRPASRRRQLPGEPPGGLRRGRRAPADAVRCTVYLTDLTRSPRSTRPTASSSPSDPPARVAVGVAALPKGAQVEIDAIVALPG